MIAKPRSRKNDNVKSASLQLSFLKENSGYRKFIEENRGRVLSAYREWRSSVLEGRAPKIPAVNRLGEEIPLADMVKGFVEEVAYTHVWFHKRLEEDFGIVNPPFDVSILSADGRREMLTADESYDLLDPMKDIEIVPKERREAALRGMFSACGIRQVVHNDEEALLRRILPGLGIPQTVQDDENRGGSTERTSIFVFELEQREKQQRQFEVITSGGTSPWFKGKLVPFPLSGLLPHERLLVVDLRKKKSELLKEFGTFFDRMKYHRENTMDSEWKRSYSRWKLDTKRTRDEAWRYLEVWKLRRLKKNFPCISLEMKISPDSAKKSFYRAYELIEGRTYDPLVFRKLYRKIKKEELSRECGECPDSVRRTCGSSGNLCPEMAAFVAQDDVPLQERLISPEDADIIGSPDPRPARSTHTPKKDQ
ncbi:MAG: hypothetical protein M0T69_08545 [Deltaproteobacteria bacterium]|nr:hypothetical protein [Deltaproteobacteria bacterium]